jgi:hypothetical protein
MNVEIGTEAAQFPEKEYVSGIFLAVWLLGVGNTASLRQLPPGSRMEKLRPTRLREEGGGGRGGRPASWSAVGSRWSTSRSSLLQKSIIF